MIYRGLRPIGAINRGERAIAAVYRGVRLVWEYISSCFGRGYWIGPAPYVGSDGWKYYNND